VLHVVRSGVDPPVDGVSAAALGRFGPWYRLQVVVTGLAAWLLTLVLLAAGLASGVGVALLAVFCQRAGLPSRACGPSGSPWPTT